MSIGPITAAALIPAKPVPMPAPAPAIKHTRILIKIFPIMYLQFLFFRLSSFYYIIFTPKKQYIPCLQEKQKITKAKNKSVTVRYSLITKWKEFYYVENEQEKKNGMVTVPERAWAHNLQRFVQEVFLRLQAELPWYSDWMSEIFIETFFCGGTIESTVKIFRCAVSVNKVVSRNLKNYWIIILATRRTRRFIWNGSP